MGRNKYSQAEISQIGKLLRLKNAGNRLQQKQIRHDLRVDYEFNISDFNEPGKAFGEQELQDAIKRGAIVILDDATIEAMKAKRARDKARDEAEREQQAIAEGEQTDWKEAMKQWKEYYKELNYFSSFTSLLSKVDLIIIEFKYVNSKNQDYRGRHHRAPLRRDSSSS